MITVYFHGLLKKYGTEFHLDAKNPAEAVRALGLQIPGLEETIKAGSWHVVRGPLEDQNSDTEESLTLSFGETTEMHLIPAAEGSNGVFNVIIGAVLIVAGVMTGFNPLLIAAGAGMLLGGIVMMTMKPPIADTNQEQVDQRASFLFSKPTNNSTQGVAIPRGYGKFMVGSIVVSTSVVAEQLLEGTENMPDNEWLNLALEAAKSGDFS